MKNQRSLCDCIGFIQLPLNAVYKNGSGFKSSGLENDYPEINTLTKNCQKNENITFTVTLLPFLFCRL